LGEGNAAGKRSERAESARAFTLPGKFLIKISYVPHRQVIPLQRCAATYVHETMCKFSAKFSDKTDEEVAATEGKRAIGKNFGVGNMAQGTLVELVATHPCSTNTRAHSLFWVAKLLPPQKRINYGLGG
jgi:hypothetical protein